MLFSNLIKVSGTYTVDLAIEWPRVVVYNHFAFVCLVFIELLLYLMYRQRHFEPAQSLTKKYYHTS